MERCVTGEFQTFDPINRVLPKHSSWHKIYFHSIKFREQSKIKIRKIKTIFVSKTYALKHQEKC